MNTLFKFSCYACIIAFTFSCGKDKVTEDPHNHSLLIKSLDEIKAEIKGKWQVKRITDIICPIFPPCFTESGTFPNSTGDYLSFLSNDIIVKYSFNNTDTSIFERGFFKKIFNGNGTRPPDSIYNFNMPVAARNWIINEIKNDTLVISESSLTYYLTK